MPYPITKTCNMDCVFCDRYWSEQDPAPDADVLRQAPVSELSGMRAVRGGGEPTLHPRLPQLLAGLRAEGVRHVSLRTNGAWAMNQAPVGVLREAGLTDTSLLFVSHDPATFDRLTRKKGSYQAVMKGAENLHAAGIRIVL